MGVPNDRGIFISLSSFIYSWNDNIFDFRKRPSLLRKSLCVVDVIIISDGKVLIKFGSKTES